MIGLDLQMFAKSAAWQVERRKSKAIDTAKKEEENVKKRIEEEKKSKEKNMPGEAVAAVNPREEYELYTIVGGKEVPVIINGSIAVRTGAKVLEKMTYSQSRKGWISKAKGNKYVVRKRR